MIENRKKDNILLFGIGIFCWIGISSLAFLLKRIALDFMFHMDLSPVYLQIISELVNGITCIIGIYIVIKTIKLNKFSDMKMFIILIGIIIIAQILGFFEPMISHSFSTEYSVNKTIKYYNYMEENISITLLITSLDFIVFIVIGIMIFLNRRKTLVNTL